MNKASLVEQIADADHSSGSCRRSLDVRDESTTDVRIVLELKADAEPEVAMAYLFKHTDLQINFHVNLTVPAAPATSARRRPARARLAARISAASSSTSA